MSKQPCLCLYQLLPVEELAQELVLKYIYGETAYSLIQGVFEEVRWLAESYEVDFPKVRPSYLKRC